MLFVLVSPYSNTRYFAVVRARAKALLARKWLSMAMVVLAAHHWSLVAGDWHSIGGREFVAELSANSVK